MFSRRSRQIIIILLVAVAALLAAVVYVIAEGRLLTRADVARIPAVPEFSVNIVNPAKTASPVGKVSYTLEVKNNTSTKTAELGGFIAGYGVKYQLSDQLADRVLKPDEIRLISDRSPENLKTENSSYVYWKIGSLKPGQSATRVIEGAVSDLNQSQVATHIRIFEIDKVDAGCVASHCLINRTLRRAVAETYETMKIASNPKITLKRQYNLFTVPYALSPTEISSFINSLKPRWAWSYDPVSSAFLDLTKVESISLVKPGAGMWLFSDEGNQVTFPAGATSTGPEDNVSLPLHKGWNLIGNPYPYPMIVSGSDILINKPEGTPSPRLVNNYGKAVDAKQISPFYLYVSDQKGESGRFDTAIVGKTIIQPYQGIWINSNEEYIIQFTGAKITNPGQNITQAEKDQIQNWIKNSGLNAYGDPQGTVYLGGTPLFDERTGQAIDLYVYIYGAHPDRPWLTTLLKSAETE